MKSAQEQLEHLPPRSTVTVTCSPAKGLAATLELTEKVVAAGHRAIPHLSARMTDSEFTLKQMVKRLRSVGVREAFVVGGDQQEPLGPYQNSFELLSAIEALEHPFQRIGITGYPEGHPKISPQVLLEDMLRKQSMADYIVTQMCFSVSAIGSWLEVIRTAGVSLPVYVGIPGAVGLARLAKIGSAIGVGASLRFLRTNLGAVAKLVGGYRPDHLLEELDHPRIAGYHIYTFNRVDSTRSWLQEARSKQLA